jgi:hypothetical protein
MNLTRCALVIAFAACSSAALAASNTHVLTITVLHDGKPVYNAAVKVADMETPPETYIGFTKTDGTMKFSIWPNATGEICVHAQTRKAPWMQSERECIRHPYPSAVRLTL